VHTELTGILRILRADVVVAGIEDILVHESGTGGDLAEERNLHGFANLHLLALLDKYLAGELAAVLAVERGHAVCLRVVALLERLERGHEVVATGNTMSDYSFCDTSCDSALDDGGDRVHGPDNLGLELWRNVELDLLEEILGCAKSTYYQDVLERAILRLDSDDLIPDKLQDTVDHWLETLQDLLVGEGHVSLLDASLRELGLNTNINSPFLTVVPEISLDSVLEIHDALGVNTTGGLGSIRQLHFPDLCSKNVTEVSIERSRTTRVARTRRALGYCERALILDFVGDKIDSTTAAIDDEHSVVDLQIQETRLRTEQRCGFRFADQRQAVVILIAEETGLDGSGSGSSLSGVVPDSGHGKVVSDISLFAVEHFT